MRSAAMVAGSLSVAAVALASVPAPGQEVTFTPRADRSEERRLDRFLREGRYRIWSRDTVLARGDTVRAPVLVLGAEARLAGTVEGPVFVVEGDLFLRPGSLIRGDAVVLGGGYYRSSSATVTGEEVYRPNLLLRVERGEGGWAIRHVGGEVRPLRPHGLAGFHLPRYRRVDAWTFGWGATVQATGFPWQPSLEGVVRLHTRGPDTWGGSLRAMWHPTGEFRFGLEAGRATRTEDGWIRGDATNTLSYLFGRGDFRDYYRSDRASFVAGWPERGGWGGEVALTWEEARSLEALPLTVFFEDDEAVRPNPAVDEGKTWSVGAELTYRRRTGDSRLLAVARVEVADSTVAGDFSYVLGEGRVAWNGPGLGHHRLELLGILRHDLSGALPRQRWSALGGSGTLATLETLERKGPRMGFLSVTYLVPLEPLRVAVLGVPKLFLRNAAGGAWEEGRAVVVEDNLVAGVRFLFVEAGLAVDVTESDLDPELVLGGNFPARFWR